MTITRGQVSTLGVTGSGTTITTTWGTLPAAGSKVLVAVQYPDPDTDLTVADNGSPQTTFTLDGSATGSGTATQVYLYRGDSISLPGSGSYSVTVTSSGTLHTIQAGGVAYTGVKTGGPVSSGNPSGTGTAVSTGNATPAAAGALFFAVFFDDTGLSPETITLTGSGFSQQFIQTNGSSFWAGAVADKIDAAGPTATPCTWTLGDSAGWNAIIAAYDAVTSGSTRTGLLTALFP